MVKTGPSGDGANQSPPLKDINLFTSDRALQTAVEREGAGFAMPELSRFGAITGSAEMLEHARLAQAHPPALETHDPRGERVDQIAFHPSWHRLMDVSMSVGLHCGSWAHLESGGAVATGANVARAGGLYLAAQMEPGHCCPITMTNAAVATLLQDAGMAQTIVPKILGRSYDPSFRHMSEKSSLTIGMGMTERQGGTDVRANTTRAEPLGTTENGASEGYRLNGHKWFLSAPMCDAFLILAQAPGGLSCFVMPRILPDGETNGIHFQRLKNKLGNRSNASCEVLFDDAQAWLIGEEGRGIPTIMEMVNYTRLDCAVSSAGLMRRALAEAIHHSRHRKVFGGVLVEQPVMTQVLADMALHVEAATALTMRLARAFDQPDDEGEQAWRRLMTPITKYWVCKTASPLISEAMECLGGNGYVEDFPLATLYREAPVNAIWEGAGNVMCLDVMRVLQRYPDAVDLVLFELHEMASGARALDDRLRDVRDLLHNPREMDHNLRALVDQLAMCAAGALMNAHAARTQADAYLASRFETGYRQTYGAQMLNDAAAIVESAAAE